MPHWECQTLQCAECKVNPVPKEEAREDTATEDILFLKYVMQTGLQLQPISTTNVLPLACVGAEAMREKAVKVLPLDHEAIMKEASKCNRLEYNKNDNFNDKSKEKSNEESKENESKLESN